MARGSTLPVWVNGSAPALGKTSLDLVNAAIVSAYTPAVIVAAADSSDAWKAHANYQCDGTADDVQIQAAIDAVDGGAGTNVAAAGDCLVILAPGNYLTTAPINIYGRVRVQGSGRGGCVIRAVTGHSAIGSATSGVVIFTDPSGVPYDHLELRDVTISGSDGGSTLDINGIYSYFEQTAAGKDADNFGGQPDIRSILRDITIVNCGRYGVWISSAVGSASTSWGLDHVRVFACGDTLSTAAGFYINGTDIWATNCDVGSQGASGSTTNIGFECAGSDNSYVGCVAWTTKGTGFKVTGSKQRLIGCNAHHSTQDGYEVTGNRNIFDGCLAYDNARDGFRVSANTCSFNACHSFDDGDSFTVTGRPQDTGFNLTNAYGNSAGNWITGTTFFSGGAGTPVAGASISDPTSYVHVVHTGNHPDGTSGTRMVVHYENGLYMGSGAGSPEGVIAAKIGSTYRQTDGGAGTTFWVKESGTSNTGWSGVA